MYPASRKYLKISTIDTPRASDHCFDNSTGLVLARWLRLVMLLITPSTRGSGSSSRVQKAFRADRQRSGAGNDAFHPISPTGRNEVSRMVLCILNWFGMMSLREASSSRFFNHSSLNASGLQSRNGWALWSVQARLVTLLGVAAARVAPDIAVNFKYHRYRLKCATTILTCYVAHR